MPIPLPEPHELDAAFGDAVQRVQQRGIAQVVGGSDPLVAMQTLVLRLVWASNGYASLDFDAGAGGLDRGEEHQAFLATFASCDLAHREFVVAVCYVVALAGTDPASSRERIDALADELLVPPTLLSDLDAARATQTAAITAAFTRNLHSVPLQPASEPASAPPAIDPRQRSEPTLLSTLPVGSVGHQVHALRRARGVDRPPPPQPDTHTTHADFLDWIRVLADIDTSLDGELETAAFLAGAKPTLESIVTLGLTAALVAAATRTLPGLLDPRAVDSLHRGVRTQDLDEWIETQWTHGASQPVEAVRRQLGISARSPEATRAGSRGPFAPGGITAPQHDQGVAVAAAEGRPYDGYGATVSWRQRAPQLSRIIASPRVTIDDPEPFEPTHSLPTTNEVVLEPADDAPAELRRAATLAGAVTAASRVFGFGRVLVISAVLGTTYLGNTFQSTNSVSNILFELLAAGGLSAVIVPALVRTERDDETEELANGVLGVATIVLGFIALAGVLAAPWIARLLTAGVPAAQLDQQRDLATFLLRLLIPQVVLYGYGAIATAVLHSQRKFASAAAAPIANTVVMVIAFGLFRWHAGADPGLDIDRVSRYLLVVAGTGGVIAFVAALGVPVWRSGIRLRPQLRTSDPRVRALLSHSGWGILLNSIGGLLAAALVVAGNVVEGGVVAFDVAFVLFLAPYAILAQPLESAAAPELTERARDNDTQGFASTLHWTIESMCALLAPLSVVIVVMAHPGMLAIGLGLGARGDGLVAAALAGLAVGLIPYSAFLIAARAYYAFDDSRTPAIASLVCGAVGVAAIVAGRLVLHERALLAALGISHSLAFSTGAVILGWRLWRRNGHSIVTRRALLPLALAGSLGLATWLATRTVSITDRMGALGVSAIGTVVFVGLYALGLRVLGFTNTSLRRTPTDA